jgi:hypothetical protein
MIELWGEVAGNLGPRARETFLDISQKQILCSMSCDVNPTAFTNRLQPVVISPLSPQVEVDRDHPPNPPLNMNQMTIFNDRQSLDLLGDERDVLEVGSAVKRCNYRYGLTFTTRTTLLEQLSEVAYGLPHCSIYMETPCLELMISTTSWARTSSLGQCTQLCMI